MKFFNRKHKKAPEPEAPEGDNVYQEGRRVWNERYGSHVQAAYNWRMFAFALALALLLSISGNIIQANRASVAGFFIPMDNLGRVSVIRADKAGEVPQTLIQAVIADCVTAWRTVTPDYRLQESYIKKLSYHTAGSAKGVMKEWYESNNPFLMAETRLVHIEIKSAPLPVSSTSYRIEWAETTRNHAGAILETARYEATVSIQIQPPTSEEVILVNPGGIYITGITAAKVFKPDL